MTPVRGQTPTPCTSSRTCSSSPPPSRNCTSCGCGSSPHLNGPRSLGLGELFNRAVVGRAHEDIVDLDLHGHLCPHFHPFGIRAEGGPRRIPRRSVLVGKDVNQLVGFGHRLPETNDGHAV